MKYYTSKFITLVIVVFLFTGCMSHWQYEIGQTKTEFFSSNKKNVNKLNLETSSQDEEVYSVAKYTPNPLFFYFKNGRLIQVDRGQRAPDIIIQNNR